MSDTARWAYLGNFSAPHSTENEIRRAAQEALGWPMDCYQEGDPASIPAIIDRLTDYAVVLWTRTRGLADRAGDGEQWRLLTMAERAGVPTVGVHLDRWWGLAREVEIATSPFFRVAHLFTADGGHDAEWAEAGVNHHWLPPAVSEFECVPGTPRDEFRSELAFVGSWDGYGHPEAWHRPALVQWLRDNYGDRCAFWPRRGEHAVRGEALRDLVASVDVFVGDSCILSTEETNERGRYWSDRIPETLGRGAVLIHPHTLGLADEHCTVYRWPMGDWDGLRACIEGALSDPDEKRRRWAEVGRADTLVRHTYTRRMERVAETLGLEP